MIDPKTVAGWFQRLMGIPWTAEEDERLREMIGDLPRQLVWAEFRADARRHGWPMRTKKAIDIRAGKLGLTFRCTGMYLTPTDVGEILGIAASIPMRWLQRYDDLPRRRFGKKWYVRRDELRRWASNPAHQRVFGGIDVDRLAMLVEDRDLAKLILQRHPTRGTHRPVRCVETGRRYASISAAARANYLTFSAIWHALNEKRRAGGWTWEAM